MSKKNSPATMIRSDEKPEAAAPEVRFYDAQSPKYPISAVSMADDVAKSRMVVRNITYPKAREAFPHEPQFQTIEYHYPLAEGGPLYVDEAKDVWAEKACAVKAEIMKEAKLRYVILGEKTALVDVMEQLEGQVFLKEKHGVDNSRK